MNFVFCLLAVIITIAAAVIFLGNLIINLVRAIKINKLIKTDPDFVEGKVIEIIKEKTRVYVRVEYYSKVNMLKFTELFELTHKEFNDQYYEGQDVKIYFPKVDHLKRVTYFPTYLEGQKMGLEAGAIFTEVILFGGGAYLAFVIFGAVTAVDETTGLIGLQMNGRPFIQSTASLDAINGAAPCLDGIYLIICAMFYLMLYGYIRERLFGLSAKQKTSYLKINGIKGTAEVKTFKFSKSKNAQGTKESILEIEFFTNSGEKVNCSLNSFLYTDTQEQYIDILYDPKNPKNVVYYVNHGK
jgi:hypothetical protein